MRGECECVKLGKSAAAVHGDRAATVVQVDICTPPGVAGQKPMTSRARTMTSRAGTAKMCVTD